MLTFAVGAALALASGVGISRNTLKAYTKRRLKIYLQAVDLAEVKVISVKKEGLLIRSQINFPVGSPTEKFLIDLRGLQEAVNTPVIGKHTFGTQCELTFGYYPFHKSMNYTSDLPRKSLAVPLYTPFGLKELDFRDEVNCHLLIGGATRMGKSALIRLVIAHLMVTTSGKISFKVIDNKITDLHMFRDIPQIEVAETVMEAITVLEEVLEEMLRRKALLKSLKDVIDLKDIRERYPEHDLPPMFVIIDEYGRFADSKEVQAIVTELAETAGYLDIHLIIGSQRPDAKDVLKPRIKANIVTRMAFTTTDEVNSRIILDLPDAAHLGSVQGRAVLLDSFPVQVQVPYLSASDTKELLKDYYRSDANVTERPADNQTIEALPGFIAGSNRFTDLS